MVRRLKNLFTQCGDCSSIAKWLRKVFSQRKKAKDSRKKHKKEAGDSRKKYKKVRQH